MIKLFTSYYANMKNIPSNYMMVGISRTCPEWLQVNQPSNFFWTKDNALAPPASLLSDMKSGKINEDEYRKRYVDHIHYIFSRGLVFNDFHDWYQMVSDEYEDKFDGIVFLCYEKPSDFCHRHILRDIINHEYKVRIDEFYYKDDQKSDKKEIKTNALF